MSVNLVVLHLKFDFNYFFESLRFWISLLMFFFVFFSYNLLMFVVATLATVNKKSHLKWSLSVMQKQSCLNEMLLWIVVSVKRMKWLWFVFEIWLNQRIYDACLFHRACHSIKGIYFSHVIQIFRCRFRVHICSNVYSALCVLHCGIVRHGNGNMKSFYMWKSQNSLNSLAVGVELCFFCSVKNVIHYIKTIESY